MDNKIKSILMKLCENGHEAYIVGGFVRDYILGKESYDVDIATSATPKEVKKIMGLSQSNDDNYGSIRFKDSIYNYDITTFRIEENYNDRRPTNIKYVDSIKEDVIRRDFTINSLYMDIDSNVHDLCNGIEDIEDGIIRVIGNIDQKLSEDPLRILRAIRFASLLNFSLEPNLVNYIKQNKQLIRTLSYTRKKEELDIIFESKNNIGIRLIKELGIEEELGIIIPDLVINTENIYGIWSQIQFNSEYPFSNNELDLIDAINSIVDYGIIDNNVLYQYGLYASIIAGDIIGNSKAYISDIYKNLPIYSVKDINISGNDIMEILNIEPSEKIKNIMNDIEINILNNGLVNEYEELKNYILKNWR